MLSLKAAKRNLKFIGDKLGRCQDSAATQWLVTDIEYNMGRVALDQGNMEEIRLAAIDALHKRYRLVATRLAILHNSLKKG